MYTLLAILLTICPKRIDEHVNNTLKQDHAELVSAMAHREVEQLFSYACPKFVFATPPSVEGDDVGAHPSVCYLFHISLIC
jgi:translation initiation factor 3 subunit L